MTGFFDGEWGRAVDFCEQAWMEQYPAETGITVVNARRLIPEVSVPVAGVAPGVPLALRVGGTRGDAMCGNPRNLTAADVTQMLQIAHYDPAMYKIIPYTAETFEPSRVVAHELAHTMMLGHGNGLDDNADGLLPPTLGRRRFDEYCDVKGSMEDTTGGTLMLPGADKNLTPLQREMARATARLVPGATLPDGVASRAGYLLPAPGSCPPDCDVPPAIKLEKIAVAETPGIEVTSFTHSLLELSDGGTYSYWVYGDPITTRPPDARRRSRGSPSSWVRNCGRS